MFDSVKEVSARVHFDYNIDEILRQSAAEARRANNLTTIRLQLALLQEQREKSLITFEEYARGLTNLNEQLDNLIR